MDKLSPQVNNTPKNFKEFDDSRNNKSPYSHLFQTVDTDIKYPTRSPIGVGLKTPSPLTNGSNSPVKLAWEEFSKEAK